ncbi:hypothetical protein [Carp edema virus]|nr:hypothetical protein [Carp edema virus]
MECTREFLWYPSVCTKIPLYFAVSVWENGTLLQKFKFRKDLVDFGPDYINLIRGKKVVYLAHGVEIIPDEHKYRNKITLDSWQWVPEMIGAANNASTNYSTVVFIDWTADSLYTDLELDERKGNVVAKTIFTIVDERNWLMRGLKTFFLQSQTVTNRSECWGKGLGGLLCFYADKLFGNNLFERIVGMDVKGEFFSLVEVDDKHKEIIFDRLDETLKTSPNLPKFLISTTMKKIKKFSHDTLYVNPNRNCGCDGFSDIIKEYNCRFNLATKLWTTMLKGVVINAYDSISDNLVDLTHTSTGENRIMRTEGTNTGNFPVTKIQLKQRFECGMLFRYDTRPRVFALANTPDNIICYYGVCFGFNLNDNGREFEIICKEVGGVALKPFTGNMTFSNYYENITYWFHNDFWIRKNDLATTVIPMTTRRSTKKRKTKPTTISTTTPEIITVITTVPTEQTFTTMIANTTQTPITTSLKIEIPTTIKITTQKKPETKQFPLHIVVIILLIILGFMGFVLILFRRQVLTLCVKPDTISEVKFTAKNNLYSTMIIDTDEFESNNFNNKGYEDSIHYDEVKNFIPNIQEEHIYETL